MHAALHSMQAHLSEVIDAEHHNKGTTRPNSVSRKVLLPHAVIPHGKFCYIVPVGL